MLNSALAKNLGVKLNDRVDLGTRRGIVKTHVVGLYKLKGTSTTSQGAFLLIPLTAAQGLFRAQKKLDSIQIVLEPDADADRVKAEIAKQLPAGLTIDSPAGRSPMAEETSLSTEQGLRMAARFPSWLRRS